MLAFRVMLAAAVAAVLVPSQRLQAAEGFVMTTPAFKDGGQVPVKHRGKREGSAGCIGENVAPAFAWSNPPAGTKSYAFILVDPEARAGSGLVHFLAYGIPASVTGVAEGELNRPSDKFVYGKGGNGATSYLGPCSTSVHPHHYTFLLVATDIDPGEVPAGLTREELAPKLNGRAKGVTGIVGLFGMPLQ